MSASVLYMSMSLDGYIAGPNDEPDNPGGDGFLRLHEWGLTSDGERHRTEGLVGQLNDEMNVTGAVLAGRRTAEQANHWGGNHHSVPIFVVSHHPPDPSVENYPLVTYVTDGIASAMAQAKADAGSRNVMVHGAYTAQRALEVSVLDELQIHHIPVLFGGGRRLFDVLPSRIELEIVRVIDTPDATNTSATASVAESVSHRTTGGSELTDISLVRTTNRATPVATAFSCCTSSSPLQIWLVQAFNTGGKREQSCQRNINVIGWLHHRTECARW